MPASTPGAIARRPVIAPIASSRTTAQSPTSLRSPRRFSLSRPRSRRWSPSPISAPPRSCCAPSAPLARSLSLSERVRRPSGRERSRFGSESDLDGGPSVRPASPCGRDGRGCVVSHAVAGGTRGSRPYATPPCHRISLSSPCFSPRRFSPPRRHPSTRSCARPSRPTPNARPRSPRSPPNASQPPSPTHPRTRCSRLSSGASASATPRAPVLTRARSGAPR